MAHIHRRRPRAGAREEDGTGGKENDAVYKSHYYLFFHFQFTIFHVLMIKPGNKKSDTGILKIPTRVVLTTCTLPKKVRVTEEKGAPVCVEFPP